MNRGRHILTRRRWLGLSLYSVATAAPKAERAAFSGYFPILQTPFRADSGIDLEDMERQVQFCLRAGVDGLVWPQLLSEFYELSLEERLEAAQVILKSVNRKRPVVIGVQAPQTALAVRMSAHAAEHGAAAVIALPPYGGTASLGEVRDYYLAIAKECSLPVIVQNTGGKWGPALPVSFVVQLAKEHAQFGHVKEEVPQILPRFADYARSGAMRSIFSGTGGKYALLELAHGTTGAMGPSGLCDIVAQIYRLHRNGDQEGARALYGLLVPVMVTESLFGGVGLAKEILVRRGVFKSALQRKPERAGEKLSEAADAELRLMLKRLAPHFKA